MVGWQHSSPSTPHFTGSEIWAALKAGWKVCAEKNKCIGCQAGSSKDVLGW